MSSAPGLAQIWSLNLGSASASATAAPPALDFGTWVVNHVLLYRLGINVVASQANATPRSETRFRGEGIAPYYSWVRDLIETVKSSAHERGVALPAIPDTPADWREEAATDYKSLAAQFYPHLMEPARASVDWYIGLLDRDPKPHWASEVAPFSVAIDLFLQMVPAMDGMMGGSEWKPFVAQMVNDEPKRVAKVLNEGLLRIRAQPGSGWDEEEARRLTEEHMENLKRILVIGT